MQNQKYDKGNKLFNSIDKSDLDDDEKEAVKTIDGIEKYEQLYGAFYNEVIPYFLETFGNIRNLPDMEIKGIDKLQVKTKNDDFSMMNSEEKEKLDKYNTKFAHGVYTLLMDCEYIRKLTQEENQNYEQYSDANKQIIKPFKITMRSNSIIK